MAPRGRNTEQRQSRDSKNKIYRSAVMNNEPIHDYPISVYTMMASYVHYIPSKQQWRTYFVTEQKTISICIFTLIR